MTKSTKKTKETPKKKDRDEEVMTPGGPFYRIYKKGKFVEMLTEEEFRQQKGK